jgi:ribosomal protein S27E
MSSNQPLPTVSPLASALDAPLGGAGQAAPPANRPKGFVDITCADCGERYGWFGHVTDANPCPHCGEPPNKREMAELEANLDAVRAEMDAEAEREWAARTPEQEAAFGAGRRAYEPGQQPIDNLKLNPYSPRNSGESDNPLRRWWSMGWNEQFSQHTEVANG